MSNRKSVFQNENPNPSAYFLQWKSDHQKFSHWDKEKEANVFIDLPFDFLVLDIFQTVKGFHKEYECGIYSNEVKRISEDPFQVKAFKGNEVIAEGLWNNIKSKVDAVGGRFVNSVYAMTKSGLIINISLQGAQLGEWFEFTKKTKARLSDEWVTATGFKEGKTGSVKYTYPCFEFTNSLTDQESENADRCFDVLETYLKKYLKAPKDSNDSVEISSDDMDILVNGEKEVNTEDFREFIENGGDPL